MSTLSQQTVANAPVSDLQSHEKILVDLGRRLRTPGNDNRETAKAALDEADSLLKHCYFLEGSLERKVIYDQATTLSERGIYRKTFLLIVPNFFHA